jgi:Tfp pilus assembly protein PilF
VKVASKIVLLSFAVVWAYLPAIHGSWLWDDGLEVTNNALLRVPDGWWRVWIDPGGMDYFPLKSALQWLEWRLWGAEPFFYHAVNVGLHILSALLVWRIFSMLGIRSAYWGGLLFAVHPMAVESVAWISEFKNTASLPLLLLSFILFAGCKADQGRGRWIGSLACFLGSVACKTSAVMFPLFLVLFSWWRSGRVTWRDLKATVLFFVASAGMGVATVIFQNNRAIGGAGHLDPLSDRVREAGWSLLSYTRLGFWPEALSPVYPKFGPSAFSIVPWVLIGLSLVILVVQRRSWGRHGLLAAGWFYLNLLPVLGIIPMSYLRISPRADHFAYLSLVAVAGVGAVLFDLLGGQFSRLSTPFATQVGRRLAPVCMAIVAGVLLASSHAYAGVFHDERALWVRAVERDPGSWLAHSNLGKVYLDEGRAEEGEEELEQAVRLQPDSAEAHGNLGNALEARGYPGRARDEYLLALKLDPGMAGAYYDLGNLYLKNGENDLAEAQFRLALSIDPKRANTSNNLGLCLARQGKTAQAIAEFREAIRLDPRLREAYLNLGNAYFKSGDISSAVQQFRQAVRCDPNYSAAHYNLSVALGRIGEVGESQLELNEARRLGRP